MLEVLRSIIQDVNNASNLEQALNIIVRRTREAMHTDAVAVYFQEEKSHELVLMAADGYRQQSIGNIRFTPNQGLVGLVQTHAEPVNIEDAHTHPNYQFVTETGEVSFHGFLGVPIIQHRQVLGVLVVRQTSQRRFSADDETFLLTLAAQLAGAISHAERTGEITRLLDDEKITSFNMKGLSGSSGIAIGEALIVFPPANLDAVPDTGISAEEVDEHISAFSAAINNVENEFKTLTQQMTGIIPSEELALFDALVLMLKSETIIDVTIDRIKAGQWAQGALRQTIDDHVKQFVAMEDPYLRERANDIKDLGRRVLMHLQKQQQKAQNITGTRILVGEEISVSQFSEIPLHNLAGIISATGSASSHVAILANALGIPAILGIEDLPVNRLKGQQIVVDGYNGQIFVKPSAQVLEEFHRLLNDEKSLNDELKNLIDKPSETLDGFHIPLQVNTGLLADITPSLKSGAEGVGLYRTEIPFLMRDGFPGEDEQTHIYKQVLQSFSPRPVTFRTLDIGGDKALPYFPVIEANPFLGWRGIRIMLDHPEIFLTQIRAILKSNIYNNNLRLMLPMICDVSEVDEAIDLINKAHKELIDEGLDIPFPSIGLMIEVPSAVYQMEALAKRVDFFSVGSNDLTQYLLAVDRNNKQVAGLYDCLHPSVLQSVQHITTTAHKYDKTVSVCGEMAGDPASALALIGLGVDSLSMSTGSLLKVKWMVRSFTLEQAKQLAEKALNLEKFSEIRSLLNDALIKAGLDNLVRSVK